MDDIRILNYYIEIFANFLGQQNQIRIILS